MCKLLLKTYSGFTTGIGGKVIFGACGYLYVCLSGYMSVSLVGLLLLTTLV